MGCPYVLEGNVCLCVSVPRLGWWWLPSLTIVKTGICLIPAPAAAAATAAAAAAAADWAGLFPLSLSLSLAVSQIGSKPTTTDAAGWCRPPGQKLPIELGVPIVVGQRLRLWLPPAGHPQAAVVENGEKRFLLLPPAVSRRVGVVPFARRVEEEEEEEEGGGGCSWGRRGVSQRRRLKLQVGRLYK